MLDMHRGGEGRFDRRTLVALAGAIVVAAVEARVGLALPAREASGRWELPGHDLAATRHGGQIAGTQVEWREELRGGAAGAPAIVDGTVYAASIGGVVASFDLATGHAHWRRLFATPVYGSGAGKRRLGFFGGVAVADERVVAASDRVFALDRRTGRTIWTTKPLRTTTSDDYFWGPPVVVRGLVLVGSGSGAELPTARGRLSAYSLRDGTLVWSTPTVPPEANGGGVIAPASVDLRANLAYVATGSPYRALPGPNPGTGSLLALRLDNGAVAWRDQVYPHDTHGFDFNSAPMIIGRIIVAASKDGFQAWDRVARRRLWHRRLTPALSKKGGVAGPMNGPEGGPGRHGRHAHLRPLERRLSQELPRGGSRTCDGARTLAAAVAELFVRRPCRRGGPPLCEWCGRDASRAGDLHRQARRGRPARSAEHGNTCRGRGATGRRRRRGALSSGAPPRLHRRAPIAAVIRPSARRALFTETPAGVHVTTTESFAGDPVETDAPGMPDGPRRVASRLARASQNGS